MQLFNVLLASGVNVYALVFVLKEDIAHAVIKMV